SVVLSSSDINATDPDNTPAQLTYTASSISGGQFELVATPSVAITSFTQAQINSGAVRFLHDGGETAPSYSLIVNDGSLNSGSSTVTIGTFTNVNEAPTISTNSLSLSEGDSVVLSSSDINATDPDNTPAQFTYTASSISGGRFELVANAGVAITSFTQPQINSGAVRFVHDGGETAPSYSLSVSDGLLSSGSSTVAIGTFTNVNDAPTLTGNATLAAVTENTNNPSGSTLTSLFGSLFSDPDIGTSLSGLAIVGNTTTTQGRWEYSIDGTTWASVGAVADDATALAFSASTLVRFVPAIGYDGTPPGLTVRALDNSYSGGFTNSTTRVTINTTTNGGTTAIAATTVLLDTSVTQSLSNLLWRKSDTGENVVWQLHDFAFQSGYSLAKVSDPNWEIADTADFNADGIADILWRNKASGENVIWEMNNTGYETDHSITKVADPNWQIAGTADFNADGTSDILWRNKASGENAIWEMDGFSVQTGHSITQVSDPNWQIADTADFNADGIADILWRNKASGENAIWEMDGFSVQTGHSITQVSNPNWQIAGTGDFNADGTSDILWRNKASGENVIWEMNDFSLQTGQLITQVSDPNWQIAGVADLGRDSTPEILWYNKPTGNQVIWEMSSLTNPQPYQLPDVSNPNWSVKPLVPVKPFVPA
ncbi:cadherin-like domain-containing protein, partial [Nostoc sp.]|uniref:cadherin-like domain-containing protein n=1 Tax=Nostoc sp. TaxID=1180 RepID=UPI002FF4994E